MRKVTFQGNPLTLEGDLPKVGDKAPDFQAFDQDMNLKSLKDFQGKIKIISSVPSLDTPVCSIETKKLHDMMKNFGDDYLFITISMDLPFAQKRWCGAEGVDNIVTLSDFKDKSFGKNYGLLIKELGLLGRCVFIVDKEDKIRYVQLVEEITNEPDYKDIEENLRRV